MISPLLSHSRGTLLGAAALCVSLLGLSCGVDVQGPEPPLDKLVFPVGMALHPNGKYLYVVNSNFEVAYREDRGGTVSVIDTETFEILSKNSVQIGTFGGNIALNTPADGTPTRAYVAVRGDRSVTVLDISEDGSTLGCNGATRTEECRITLDNDDPFNLIVSTFEFTPADAPSSPEEMDFVAVAHLLGSNVTAFTYKDAGLSSVNQFSTPVLAGINAIAQSPRTGQFYAGGRFEGRVVSFQPGFDTAGEVIALYQTSNILLDNAPPYNGLDSRSIAFSSDGARAYVSNRGPRALIEIDTGPSDLQTNRGTRNRVIQQIPVSRDPAEVQVVSHDHAELVYVASYTDSLVTVIDPAFQTVVDTIKIPAAPYAMVVDMEHSKRMYVSMFEANAIAVIDLDSSSPSFHQVIAVIR